MRFFLLSLFLFAATAGCQQKAGPARTDLHVAQLSGRYGYISSKGEIKINPQFETASEFAEGLAVVSISGKKGYIDVTGKYIINPQFENALPFSEGVAAVSMNNKWGYIDKTGKLIINPQFDVAEQFLDGLAHVAIGEQHGYIEKDGKYKINPQFSDATVFSDGLAAVAIGGSRGNGGNYGYIDKSGKFVINPQFSEARPFRGGLACVAISSSGNYGFINKKGQFVINPTYESADSFSEKLAAVSMGGKFGYLDPAGKIVINFQFDKASSFDSGKALIMVDDRYSYIDLQGKRVIEGAYDDAARFSNGVAHVYSGGKLHPLWHIIENSTGQCIDSSGKVIFTEAGNTKTIRNSRSLDPELLMNTSPTELLNTPHVHKILNDYLKEARDSLDGFQCPNYTRWNVNGNMISCELQRDSYGAGYLREKAFICLDISNAEFEIAKYKVGNVSGNMSDSLWVMSKVSNLDEMREETKHWVLQNKGYQTNIRLITKNSGKAKSI